MKMKRFTLIVVMALSLISVSAADKELLIPVYLTEQQHHMLPEKTDFVKVPQVECKDGKYSDFLAGLIACLTDIAATDVDHNVYSLKIQHSGTDLLVNVVGRDVLQSSEKERKNFKGDMIIERAHFIILEDDDNRGIFKAMFRKAGGNVRIEHVFEFVPEVPTFQPTVFRALWKDNNLSVSEYVVGGEDKLTKKGSEL